MGKALDITGQKFQRLLAVQVKVRNRGRGKGVLWEFLCDCGETVFATPADVRSGNTGSCGCLQRDRASEITETPVCNKCGVDLTDENCSSHKTPTIKNRWYICNSCKEQHVSEKKEKLDYRLYDNMFNKYGITVEDYLNLLEDQQGVCAICKRQNPSRERFGVRADRRLFVDHCHETGNVRGLLCMYCNTGLGMFKDNIEYLLEAINYLRSSV